MVELLLDKYIEREIELIVKRNELCNDPLLEQYRVNILPLICKKEHLLFYAPMLEKEEKMYKDALSKQNERRKSFSNIEIRKEYYQYDDFLRVLDNSIDDIRYRMYKPFYEKLDEWKLYKALELEKQVSQGKQLTYDINVEYGY
jgi:hypothetical protein